MMVVLYSRTVCVLVVFVLFGSVVRGTEPAVQSIPRTWDFSAGEPASTNYPPGVIGWKIGLASGASFVQTPALSDALLTAPSSASGTSGGMHNYAGKLGLLDSGSGVYALACAINTLNTSNIVVTFEIMTIRNPFDGISNTRSNACALFYRVGTTGDFTLLPYAYTNDATQQKSGTLPQRLETPSVPLPAACENQPVVQLRWAGRDLSGKGQRPSFAIGRIAVACDGVAPPPLAPPQNIRVIEVESKGFHLAWDPVAGASGYAIDLYSCTGSNACAFFEEDFRGFSGGSNISRDTMLDTCMQTNGWTGCAVYEAYGSVRLGNSTTRGWLQTPVLAPSGRWSIFFDAHAWDGDTEATTIDASLVQDGVTNVLETLELPKAEMRTFVLHVETLCPASLSFSAKRSTSNRFYLDNLSISPGWYTQTVITNGMHTVSTTAAFHGLRPGVTYTGVIRSLSEAGESTNSSEFIVRTFNATLILLH